MYPHVVLWIKIPLQVELPNIAWNRMGKSFHFENFPHVTSSCGTFYFIRLKIKWVKVSNKRTSLMYSDHLDFWIKVPLQMELSKFIQPKIKWVKIFTKRTWNDFWIKILVPVNHYSSIFCYLIVPIIISSDFVLFRDQLGLFRSLGSA